MLGLDLVGVGDHLMREHLPVGIGDLGDQAHQLLDASMENFV